MAPVQEADDNTSCPVGASKRFECQVIGLPRPSVRWYKDGVNITTNSRYKFEYTQDGCVVLVLENVTADDQGVYSCTAQNSEGSAETVAQLFIKGALTAADANTPSVHAMSSFKKVEDKTSKSQRRPLLIGRSGASDKNVGDLKEVQGDESLEKGTREMKQQKDRKEFEKAAREVDSGAGKGLDDNIKSDELSNMVEDLLELTKFGNSGRRLTTDSGITSRGSSFSSEPDISITEESMKEMKEYLHGKADALYQSFEHGKLKEITESGVEVRVARSQKLVKKEKAMHSKEQIMSMTELTKEKIDFDRVNELEASVLAGMYLFDTGPPDKTDKYRHGIPALELLVRKEALENISDRGTSQSAFEDTEINASTNVEKHKLKEEFRASEIIHEIETADNIEVEKLNAINIERSNGIVRKQAETKLVKAKTVTCVEEEDDDVEIGKLVTGKDKTDISSDICDKKISSKLESIDQTTELKQTNDGTEFVKEKMEEKKKFQKRKGDSVSSADETDNDRINVEISCDTTDTKSINGGFSSSSDIDKNSKAADDISLGKEESLGNSEEDFYKRNDDKASTVCAADKGRVDIDNSTPSDSTDGQVNKSQVSVSSELNNDLAATDDFEINEEVSVQTKLIGNGNKEGDIEEKLKKRKSNEASSDDNGGQNRKETETALSSDTAESKHNEEKSLPLQEEENDSKSTYGSGLAEAMSVKNQQLQDTKENKLVDNERQSKTGEASKEIEANLKSIISDTEKQSSAETGQKLYESEDKIEANIDSKLSASSDNADLTDGRISGKTEKDGSTQDVSVKLQQSDGSKKGTDNKNKDEGTKKNAHERPEISNLEQNLNDDNTLTSKTEDNSNQKRLSDSLESSSLEVMEDLDGKSKPESLSDNKKFKETNEQQLCEQENTDESKANNKGHGKESVEENERLTSSGKRNNKTDDKEFVLENMLAEEKSNTGNESKLELRENKDFLSDKSADKTNTDRIDAKAGSDLLESANETDSSVTEKSRKKKEVSVSIETESNVEHLKVESGNENHFHQEKYAKSEEEISIACTDVVKKGVSKEEQTREEFHRNKSAELEKGAKKNREIVEEATVSFEKHSKTKTAKVEQQDQKKENVYRLYSANETADAGTPFTEPLKDLVYLDDTHPEIPNIINIMPNMKENEIRKKDASLTEEIENRMMPLNEISEESPLVASVKVTEAIDSLMVQSADAIDLATLESEQSIVESTDLSEKSKTETTDKKIVIKEDLETVTNVAEIKAVKISESNETLTKLKKDKTEEKIMAETSSKESQVPNGDKVLDPNIKIVDKEKEAVKETSEEILDKENSMVESKVIETELDSKAEIKSDLEKVCFDEMTEERIVPEHSKRDEKVPNLQDLEQIEKKATKQTDESDLNKTQSLPADESDLSDKQKNADDEEPKKIKDALVDEKTDKTLKLERSKLKVEVLVDNTHVQVPEGLPAELKWKISGVELSKVSIYKDGQKIKVSANIHVDVTDNIYSLTVDKATVDDEATYSIRTEGSEIDHGEIRVQVTTSEKKLSNEAKEPKFIVESEVDVKEGRRLSIKCSISDKQKNGDAEELKKIQDAVVDETDKTLKLKSSKLNVEALVDDTHVQVPEGFPAKLQWKISGVELSKVSIYKDGQKIKIRANIHVDVTDNIYSLTVDKATVDDEATYSIRTEGSEIDHGEIRVQVTTSEKKLSNEAEEPKFIIESEVDVKEGKRLSIKCSISDKQKNGDAEELKKIQDAVVDETDKTLKLESSKLKVEALVDDTHVQVPEGFPAKLQWKISGVELSKVSIYKDGQKIKVSANIHVDDTDNIYSLTVDKATVDDEATYSIRTEGSEIDHGEIRVQVTTSEKKLSNDAEEPKFIVEPVVDVKEGRRLSIKCSVSGSPAPEVTWYHQGQQLDPNALWEIYSKDGYHYLTVGDPSILDCEEIVCRVENDNGYVQRVIAVKRDGDEVYCEPVLPPVSPEPSENKQLCPSIEIEISEIVTTNLRKLPLADDFKDRLNFVTLKAGDIVEILASVTEGTVLARNLPQKEKVCYIPKQALAASHDVSRQVCESASAENNTGLTEQQSQNNKEEATMPERRKMKSPSPKMTSTPKMKRKEMDTESTEELQKRLGFSDNLAQRKEFSTPDSVEFTEYNDGTTRPMFKKRLKSVTAKSGEMAQLECTVSGSPLPKILWLKNNRPLKASDGCKVIVDEGTNILVFPQAREEDVGIYTARAMNVNGSIMCSAEFTLSDGSGLPAQPVTDSPMDMDFTTPAYFFQMSSCEVAEGRLARFDCRVVAYPKPEIVWMRDGKVIEAEQRFKLLNFNNEIYSLLVQDVRIDDTGRYTCWARNKFGEAMTEAYLNVLALSDQEPEGDLAPKFLTRFYDQQTTEGTATDFKCLIAGRPEPSVTWLLDDLEIREGQGVRMRHKDGMVSLEIKSPKVDQSGTYTCQLNNPLGEATCSARLTVVEDKLHGKMLPKFLKKFDHVTVKEGEEARFTSVIIGEPRPDVIWLFDHKPISDTNRRFMTKKEGDAYTLIIKNVRFDDGGKITCKASNEEGEVYCSANLHVRESKFMTDLPEKTGVRSQDEIDAKFGYVPTFTRRLQDLEVKEGSRAFFECKVMGIPDPEISWMKDGRVITPGGRYRMTFEGGTGQLVIDNVTAADTGVYTCIVSNSQGKSSSTAALKLEEPKKERYTPDRLLEERTSRKERYTPDKYLFDDSTTAKRPYLDTDRYDAAKVRKSYESPITTTKLDDTYLPRPKKKYDSPKSSYDSFKPKYDTSYESPKRSLESPRRQFDSAYTRLESPVRQYDTYTRYESPVRPYESVSTKYESPVRPYESVSTKYESPIRPYESVSTKYESPVRRYESPVRQFDSGSPRTFYESPRRRSSVGREEKIKAVPKIPFDRPALLNKRDDSVQLSWLPAPTYNLPDDARHVSYIIESREIPSRDWTKVATSVPGTSYTVRNIRPDKEYEFRVRAQNQHGVGEPTWNATFDKRVDETSKQLDLPEMRAPPRLPTHRPIITDLGAETMRLAWRPVETYQARRTPPVSYRLEAKELPGRDWMPLSSHLRDTSHYLSELARDRDYMIRVRAENDFGISEPTEPLWIPRATAFPGVPVTRPEIIDYEDTRAKLSWTRVDIPSFGLDDTPLLYMLEVEEPPHKDWRTIARDLDDTEYIVEGLKPGHDYRFRVRAKTPTGIISEPSPAVSLYTKLAQTRAPIDRLEVLEYEPDTKSVHLSWDRVNIPPYNMDEEPLMYMLEYQEPPLPEWKTLITGIPTTRYRVMHLDRDRDYNFRVRALTPYGISPPSPALPVTLRQTPGTVTRGLPEKVIISDVDAHSLRLTWRRPMYDIDKPISYQVEMLESPFSDWRPIASRVMETTYKVTGLKPTRDYQFRVIPQVDTEYLAPSPSAALTTMPVKPRLPYAEPRLKELTPESVQLSWGAAELPAYQRKRSPIHYKVEMAELPSSNWVPVSRKVTDTSYTVTGLRPNQEYKFRVFAESDSGLSEPSMPTTLYRRPAPRFPLKEPSIRDLSQNVVHLTWSPAEVPSGAEGVSYMVEVQTPPGISAWNTLYRQHPSPSVRLADLRPDLDYLVRVRAQSGTYLSEPTLPVYIPRRAAPPRLPVEEPYAVEINPDFVKLQWRSADLPTHIQDYAPVSYRLEAQELPDTNWVTIARGIPYTDFKVTGLNAQRDYNFRVRAENEYGLSDPTRPMVIRKRAVPPTLPTYEPMLYDIGPGSARLSWRPASLPSFMPSQSPITYTLFVQDLPYKTWRPLVKGIPHTSYYVTGLQPDKEYMFRVQAENQFGSSRPTDAVRLPRFKDHTRPISVPEVSDFDEDLTSVKLRWMPTRTSPPFETKSRKYTIETWEPVRREWKPVARGVPDTSYQIRGLPKLPDHLFRVRMDTEEPALSEPSIPVSLSRYSLPRAPMYRPQLYELEDDSVRLSWQPVHVPEGVSRRSVRYTIEQREIPEPHWSPIATDIIETSYKVRGLRSKIDYEFRVKATYDGISTEPSYPVSLFRRAVIPKVRLDAPEVYDVDDTSLSLRWNTVDVPAFTPDEEPLLFVIERQTLPSYEWQPVATNITDKSYTIKDLKPYQDYNFRVRGVYPSGYTEPSPNVPVYRRPSESKIGLVGIESRTLDFKSYISQKYFPKITASPSIPTKSLHATLPSDISPIVKKAIETRLRSYSSSPQRRYSVANIYDSRELYTKEADFKKLPAPVPEPKFKLENAYVYKRSRSPVKFELPSVYETVKVGQRKKVAPKKENDLYAYYKQLHRRYSDAGIDELTRRRSRKSEFIEDKLLEERRAELVFESQHRRLLRRGSLPTITPRVARPTEPSVGYPSVADRYEDIKCPYIVSPGHWRFARRHSVALDWEDLQRIQRQLQTESRRLETKRRTRSEMPKAYKPKYDFISQTQDEYFKGTHFRIEDQLNFNDMRPRIPLIDQSSAYHRRSLSQERDPGYFILSKFTLSIAGDRKPASTVRPASLEPSPVARLPREYRSYTPNYRSYTPDYRSYTPDYRSFTPDFRPYTPDYRSYTPEYRSHIREYRSYSPEYRSHLKTRSMTPDLYLDFKSRSQTPDFHDTEKRKRSMSLAQELARSRLQVAGFKPAPRDSSERSRQASPSKPIRRPSPPRQKEAFVKPRSYSISVPRAEVKKFNRIVEDSKSLITRYEHERSRQSSVADLRSDPRFTSTPRGSAASLQVDVYSDSGYSSSRRGSISQHSDVRADPRFSLTPRGSISQHSDVRADPRFSSTPRGSLSVSRSQRSSINMSPAEKERLASIKADTRFSAQRRATIATNDDLKSKLDTVSSHLIVPKQKKKKSSRPTIKYKSSRGEGAL